MNKRHTTLDGNNMRISYREGFIENEEIFENHCHTRYELIAVFDGKVTIVVGNRKSSLRTGETVVIPPLVYHSVFAEGDTMYKRATVLFDESFIPPEIFSDFKERGEAEPISTDTALGAAAERLRAVFLAEAAPDKKYIPLVKSILTEMVYLYTYRRGAEKREKLHPTVKLVTEYIDSHIAERITLDDIASSLFISKSSISHLFREEMKISVKQYVLHKKLGIAVGLIEDGKLLTEVAETVGYENYANFYRMYKKITGKSPRESKRSENVN